MVIDLLAVIGKICGFFDNGGEIINCLLMFFNFTNSLKVSLIDLLENSVLKFFGILISRVGGIVSFRPPDIDPRLAQPTKTSVNRK
jgi:hypothetical protein